MRETINIQGNNHVFPYIVEYSKGHSTTQTTVEWSKTKTDVKILNDSIKYYRNVNEWYGNDIVSKSAQYMPDDINISNIKVYIPTHSASTYINNVRYMLSLCVWINGVKVDLGSYMFNPIDALAVDKKIANGNNEYYEYFEFDIIDPFYILYSDDWTGFRNNVCKEPLNINTTSTPLYVSLFVVEEYDGRYIMKKDWVGGSTNFTISDVKTDLMSLGLEFSQDPIGLKYNISINPTYDWILTYLKATYGLNLATGDIYLDLIIKTKDSAIVLFPKKEDKPTYNAGAFENGKAAQILSLDTILDSAAQQFFESWNYFEEGWSFAGALVAYNNDDEEILNIVSNELPITQELYSNFTNGGSEKIIDLNDMNKVELNVVNKIENKIIHVDKPETSKANIIQPVFFRAKETEVLTIHPQVTENISINLDDYKSKVKSFILQIDNCKFNQIGSNSYGIIFKVIGNKIPASVVSGTYYILNEEYELVTTGKYSCVR